MTEYEALRREIEIRLIRETVYRGIEALNTKGSLQEHIEQNDKVIALIGKYLLGLDEANGQNWEKFYQANK